MNAVDIIIPVKNGTKYVDSCIKTITNQTFSNYKVLFVTDMETKIVLDERIKMLPNFSTILRNDTDTAGIARNIGLENSYNDIIWFLDIDDFAFPSFLEEMVETLNKNNADIVFCNLFLENKTIIPCIPNVEYTIKTFDNYTAIKNLNNFPTYPWAHIQKRTVFNDKTLFSDIVSSEDLDQIIRELAISKKVCYYNKPLYIYYKRRNNLTMQNRKYDALSIEIITRESLSFVKKYRQDCYKEFETTMLKRLIRQIAFVNYSRYCQIYKITVAHDIIRNLPTSSMETFIFSHS